ncbi:MAG: hypothetical protein IJD75_02335 [Clostridia bacterium]|nr:hypothetical protein [Clostridia bacterium]
MKKTLKIALVLCLALAMALSATACFGSDKPAVTTPATTTPQATTPEVTTPDVTTPQETPDPDKPEGAVLVDSVGGKNATELLEAFATAFTTATSYDWSAEMTVTEEGFSMTQTVAMKLSESEFALVMGMDGEAMEIYFVDDVLYMNSFGEKMQIPADSIDEILGEGALESFLYMAEGFEVSDAELAAAADAKIYRLNDKYIITLHYVNEDTGLEETSKYYFNATGEMIEAESTSDAGYALITVHSYNKPVEIDPPADADEYLPMTGEDVEPPVTPGDEEEIYLLYAEACTALQNADHYSVFFNTPEMNNSIDYDVAGKDKFLMILDADGMLELWYIDNKGYAAFDGGDIYNVTADDAFFSYFTSVEEQFPINVFAKEDVIGLTCSYDTEWEETVIEFICTTEFGGLCQYRYALADDGSYVDVTVFGLVDGEAEELLTCLFMYEPELEIVLPEVG